MTTYVIRDALRAWVAQAHVTGTLEFGASRCIDMSKRIASSARGKGILRASRYLLHLRGHVEHLAGLAGGVKVHRRRWF